MEQILFGKYIVTGLLGASANSQVYLVRHRILNQERAVKQIPKSLPDSSGFLAEAELMKSLKHSGIPMIYDIEEDETSYYLIEEYVRGESLEAYVLHQKTISLQFFLHIGRQLCDIIGYLHEQSIIYQDLKPEHIIVYGDQIKIIDFGIASFFRDGENPYQFYGTARYAAPEKQLGQPCDERTDIYGIGVILQFLEPFLFPEEHSLQVQRVIARALAEEPSQRFATADLLKAELFSEIGQESDGKEHLFQNLAVLGMKRGIGTTHVAVSWNVYLNAAGRASLYVQQDQSGDLQRMVQAGRVRRDPRTGCVSCGDFLGTAGVHFENQQESPSVCRIRDFGTYEAMDIELETCDAAILILGGREWELECARQIYEKLWLYRRLVLVVNYGNEHAARMYARNWRRNVYCFPLDDEPFALSEKKRQFFELLYKKEGW